MRRTHCWIPVQVNVRVSFAWLTTRGRQLDRVGPHCTYMGCGYSHPSCPARPHILSVAKCKPEMRYFPDFTPLCELLAVQVVVYKRPVVNYNALVFFHKQQRVLNRMLTIHFWQWGLLRLSPQAKISAIMLLETVHLYEKVVVFFCFAQPSRQMKTNELDNRAAHSLLWTTTAFVYMLDWNCYCEIIIFSVVTASALLLLSFSSTKLVMHGGTHLLFAAACQPGTFWATIWAQGRSNDKDLLESAHWCDSCGLLFCYRFHCHHPTYSNGSYASKHLTNHANDRVSSGGFIYVVYGIKLSHEMEV